MYKNPFIKVEWEDVPENITQERIKRVKAYFKNKYNSDNIKVITKISSNSPNIKLKSLDSSDNILDVQYQKKLMKEFITENTINVNWDLINRLDDKVNSKIDSISKKIIRYNKWIIKRIEFSNFLCYGENNVIDFTKMDGITVVESTPKNFGGKTIVTIDLLLFLFFNSTTKTKTNIEIFNKFTDVDDVKVTGYIVIDGEDYVITRTLNRKKTKLGDFNIKTNLEFNKISQEGDILNLSGEQRKETENIITSAIGTEEDFLLTILTTGDNLNDLITSKPTARGQILNRFLGLENLKEKEDVCKELYNEWSKKLLSNTNNIKDLEITNETNREKINESNLEIQRLNIEISNETNKLKQFEEKRDDLSKKRNNDIDPELNKINPDALKNEINKINEEKKETKKIIDSIIVIEPEEYYVEENHEKLKKEINDILVKFGICDLEIQNNENLIEQLINGEFCPTCKRKLDEVDHTTEINLLREKVNKLKEEHDDFINQINVLKIDEEKLNSIKKVYYEYETNKLRKSRYELEYDQKDLLIQSKEEKIKKYEENKIKLENNQNIDSQLISIKSQIQTINGTINGYNVNIGKYKSDINSLEEKINLNLELIKKIKAEEEYIPIFKTYLNMFGKNGISKVILKNMIPVLNQELHRILIDSCYFTLEINLNDRNELEFLMIDNETRIVKPLNSGSGYEKTISSLAFRSILTKISSLPKPNIVVMDEVFGKIADENLEMVGEFFLKIKDYFEHIFVISHNPLIRNWSDNFMMVKKEENVSYIENILTKN